jgi:hypothetical protein
VQSIWLPVWRRTRLEGFEWPLHRMHCLKRTMSVLAGAYEGIA